MNRFNKFLEDYNVLLTIKHMFNFIVNLIIVLSVATLFMRFAIICGVDSSISLVIGIVSGFAANVYKKFN